MFIISAWRLGRFAFKQLTSMPKSTEGVEAAGFGSGVWGAVVDEEAGDDWVLVSTGF